MMTESGTATGISAIMRELSEPTEPSELSELLPDARDGLNRKERTVLYCLMQTQKEFRDRNVPTITLYGRVLEHIDMGEAEFQHILAKMTGLTRNSDDPTRSD
jgi:hypothetical protein